jgi:cellulose synthase/poly-beta-1,6-N-acetylglucosamine synthase-like glycosyltransferase
MLTLLFLSACLSYLLLNLQLVRGLRRVGRTNAAVAHSIKGEPTSPADLPLITVLVAARNEEQNLPRTLEALLAQDWPHERTQIVIVDDRSTDATPTLLRDYAAREPGRVTSVRVETSAPGVSPKKNALALGLTMARGSWIAVTDADCLMGPGWLRALAAQFGSDQDKVGMVFGVTAYGEPAAGFSPAEGTRALEFISYGVTNAGLAGHGFPVSANANNLAYRRQAFEDAGGFGQHRAVVSGDDDFTLQGIHAAGWNFRFCTTPAALVRTTAPATWAEFWEQRKRWAGKCIHYRAPQVAFLTGIYLFYSAIALFLLAGLFRIGGDSWGLLGLIGLASKAVGDFASMRAGLSLFGLGTLLRFFPLTSALHIPLVIASVPMGTLGSFTWKGQKLARKA